MNAWHEEALEINKLVDEFLEHDKNLTPQQTAEMIIAEKKFEHLDKITQKEDFGKGWGEEMQRQLIASHPAVKKVEDAPAYSDYEQKTDAFVDFDKGRIAVQLTLNGAGEHGSEKLSKKFNDMLTEKFSSVTYYGKKEVPLTMTSAILGEFLNIHHAWEERGGKGSPLEFMAPKRREDLANEFISRMAKVFEWKYIKLGRKEFKEWSEYLKGIYEKRAEELKKERAVPPKRNR